MSSGTFSNWKFLAGGGGGTIMPDQPGSFGKPKLKFNFTARFTFRNGTSFGATGMEELDVQLKDATRPSINIVYDEKNFYNFRTKVKKKVDYGTVSLSYYDDPDNKAHGVLTNYLKRVSPIANLTEVENESVIRNPAARFSSLQVTNDSEILSPIKEIKITHYYINNGSPKQTTYQYINPRLEKLEYGDLTMTETAPTLILMSFNYDTVFITEG